jgi:hypothetical protein
MNRIIAFSLLLLLTTLISCQKYEDGPAISFRSAETRVTNDWQVLLISKNDIEITSDYEYIHMNFKANGLFEWFYKLSGDPTEYKFEGKDPRWEMATLNSQIKVTYFDEAVGADRLLYFEIFRLTSDELWVNYIEDGDRYSLRMAPR